MKSFQEKVAVITGAGSGIGRALALQLAQQGCHLALCDVNESGLKETQDRLCHHAVTVSLHVLDVADEEAFSQVAKAVMAQYGQVDLLFNNAGVAFLDLAKEQDLESFHWLMNINFWGVVHGCKAFMPYLSQSSQGAIVNVSSLFGIMSVPLQSAYNASKFAVRGYTEALRTELSGSNIQVLSVHPGGIKTPIVSNARLNNQKLESYAKNLSKRFEKQAMTTPERAASIILKAVKNKKRRVLVGPDAKILDLLVRLFPARYGKWLGFERIARKRLINL